MSHVLAPHASTPAAARALVRDALEAAGLEDWVDRAQLAVSELVTNALLHAGTSIELTVRAGGGAVRVEVADGSPHLPVVRAYSSTSGTGRGLKLIEKLVEDWGVTRRTTGKVVWFELRPSEAAIDQEQRAAAAADSESSADVVTVELLNFPLLMHAAWQEHASALLREFLLTGMDEEDLAAFQRHAQASDAMNILYEQAPAPVLDDDPDAIMTSATEPGVSLDRLVLRVPTPSIPNFAVLDAMLAEATELAAAGGLLVPPTQPEVGELRRWICRQVHVRLHGDGSPERWSPTPWAALPGGVADGPVAEYAEISDSDEALLATDETSRIVALSSSAVSLLGYAKASELLGQRVIAVIPTRYHQAHIAGITLHMTNGRDPLLAVRVTVPVVRADGSEIATDLLVNPRLLSDDRRIFVAEFTNPSSPLSGAPH